MNSTGRVWARIRRIAASDRISGLIMLAFAFAGLVLANLPWTSHMFEAVAETQLGIPGTNIILPIGHWAQDGLLTIFFLTVGLDLKQELTTGSLADPKAAAVPMLCAVGGMLMPPVLFITVISLFSRESSPSRPARMSRSPKRRRGGRFPQRRTSPSRWRCLRCSPRRCPVRSERS